MPQTEEGLYDALESALKASKDPMDCVALFELSSVREHAASINRVSDYLGNLWRKGKVMRLPAPLGRDTKSRWMYVWRGRVPDAPDPSKAVAHEPAVLVAKPNIQVTNDGNTVVVRLPYMTLTIETHEPK